MKVIMLLMAMPLAACAAKPLPRPVETKTQVVEVPVRAPCPDPAERNRLRKLRPVPLAEQPMPPTARERVGKMSAQLGRYEAPGGWADQIDAALDRCQQR